MWVENLKSNLALWVPYYRRGYLLWSAFWRVLYTCLVYCTQGVVCYVTSYPVACCLLFTFLYFVYYHWIETNTVAFITSSVSSSIWPCSNSKLCLFRRHCLYRHRWWQPDQWFASQELSPLHYRSLSSHCSWSFQQSIRPVIPWRPDISSIVQAFIICVISSLRCTLLPLQYMRRPSVGWEY